MTFTVLLHDFNHSDFNSFVYLPFFFSCWNMESFWVFWRFFWLILGAFRYHYPYLFSIVFWFFLMLPFLFVGGIRPKFGSNSVDWDPPISCLFCISIFALNFNRLNYCLYTYLIYLEIRTLALKKTDGLGYPIFKKNRDLKKTDSRFSFFLIRTFF